MAPTASSHLSTPTYKQGTQTTNLPALKHHNDAPPQALQPEHDQLLTALSTSQSHCSMLEKESQISENKIDALIVEKRRLQQQLSALDNRADELGNSRNCAQKQSEAERAQWLQIVTMSSQLQAQGIDEVRKFSVCKESWECDRATLQRRIQDLEAGKFSMENASESGASTTRITPDDNFASASSSALRAEIVRLRRICEEMETPLKDIEHETDQIGVNLSAISDLRDQIKHKAQQDFLKE